MSEKLEPQYSGPASIKVWDRIAKIEDLGVHDMIYIAACALQDHETRLLQMIDAAARRS